MGASAHRVVPTCRRALLQGCFASERPRDFWSWGLSSGWRLLVGGGVGEPVLVHILHGSLEQAWVGCDFAHRGGPVLYAVVLVCWSIKDVLVAKWVPDSAGIGQRVSGCKASVAFQTARSKKASTNTKLCEIKSL